MPPLPRGVFLSTVEAAVMLVRFRQTAALVDEMAPELGLDPAGVSVRSDPEAAETARRAGARGVMRDGAIHLDPDRFDPAAAEGRALVAHELVHVAQRVNPAPRHHDPATLGLAAEAEARSIGGALAGRAAFRPVSVGLPGHAIAAETKEGEGERSAVDILRGKVAAADTARKAKTAAGRVVRSVTGGELPHDQAVALAGACPADTREVFIAELARRAGRWVRGKLPSRGVPRKSWSAAKVTQWLANSGWPVLLDTWVASSVAWRDALPEERRAAVTDQLDDRLGWILKMFQTPNYGAFKKQQPWRVAFDKVIRARLGDADLDRLYRDNGRLDCRVSDAGREQTAARATEAALPYDASLAQANRTILTSSLNVAAVLPGLVDAEADLTAKKALVPSYYGVLEWVNMTLMAYKRSLKLGTRTPSAAEFGPLQAGTATLQQMTNHLNGLAIELDGAHVKAGGVGNQRPEDQASASWWRTVLIPGMQLMKRPEKMSISANKVRDRVDVDQVVLHEGGRTTGGMIHNWATVRPASSHFGVAA